MYKTVLVATISTSPNTPPNKESIKKELAQYLEDKKINFLHISIREDYKQIDEERYKVIAYVYGNDKKENYATINHKLNYKTF